MAEKINVIAPCGLACGACPLFLAQDNPKLAEMLADILKRPVEEVPCSGCRSLEGRPNVLKGQVCNTYACVEEKGHTYCYECAEFPCANLSPCMDKAQQIPHNHKIYNLLKLQKEGVDEFMKHAARRYNRFLKGKLSIGGPLNEPEV